MEKQINTDTTNLQKLSNEFAMVRFGKVTMQNGERLLIQSSGGDQVLLDPILLEAIASLGHEDLSRILVVANEVRD
ncbi:hypothetical protein [Bacillus sp. B15-48]|uniref:hypothetical protein n=1 Tax=Bacillus sp. B15-48 TaxID=1548601 RepID=UPI00193F06C7|nr:hypothetical protein [Bacillus sp. B15-48]MBM4764994.1 dihydrodiol dehydrogenase [Bacillus sp. B15-48]